MNMYVWNLTDVLFVGMNAMVNPFIYFLRFRKYQNWMRCKIKCFCHRFFSKEKQTAKNNMPEKNQEVGSNQELSVNANKTIEKRKTILKASANNLTFQRSFVLTSKQATEQPRRQISRRASEQVLRRGETITCEGPDNIFQDSIPSDNQLKRSGAVKRPQRETLLETQKFDISVPKRCKQTDNDKCDESSSSTETVL